MSRCGLPAAATWQSAANIRGAQICAPRTFGYADGVTTSSGAAPAWISGIPGVPGAVLLPDSGAGLRERKKVATRRALGIAAMRLAVERGLDNVLVEDIADAAGVSARTFNNYFASKNEAICAVGFDRAMRIGAALRE